MILPIIIANWVCLFKKRPYLRNHFSSLLLFERMSSDSSDPQKPLPFNDGDRYFLAVKALMA